MNDRPSVLPAPGALAGLRKVLQGPADVWLGLGLAGLFGITLVGTLLLWKASDEAALAMDHMIARGALGLWLATVPVMAALLLRGRRSRGQEPALLESSADPARPAWLSPVAAGSLLLLLFLLGGLATYRFGSRLVEQSMLRRLEVIATLKESLVEAWIEDALDDIRIWSVSPEFTRALQSWQPGDAPDSAGSTQMLDYLWRLSRTSHYGAVVVRDATSGRVLLATREGYDVPGAAARAVAAAADIPAAATAPHPVLDKLGDEASGGNGAGPARLGFLAVVKAGAVRVVLQIDVDRHHDLFRLINEWPGNPDTVELLLLRPQRGALEVLNDEASAPHAAAAARLIPTDAAMSLGQALARQRGPGFARGDDDRGHAVLAYARPVSGTPWLLVAKVDESEAFGELNRTAGLAAAMAAGLLMIGGLWGMAHHSYASAARRLQRERTEQAERLAELSRRVVTAQEGERHRFAVELHDRTGANLSAIQLNLKAIARSMPAASDEDRELLAETGELLGDTVVSIREFCADLRPTVLDYAGLVEAIGSIAAQFSRRTGIEVRFEQSGMANRLHPELESVLFRIVQEALMNCAKHARASLVQIRLEQDARHLRLEIADDGAGFEPARLGQGGKAVGHGLLNMRERAAFAGGALTLDSAPGSGTRVRFEMAARLALAAAEPPPLDSGARIA